MSILDSIRGDKTMTILFTEEEKRYLQNTNSGDYRLAYREGTPDEIAKSIRRKISAHKQWLKEVKNDVRSSHTEDG